MLLRNDSYLLEFSFHFGDTQDRDYSVVRFVYLALPQTLIIDRFNAVDLTDGGLYSLPFAITTPFPATPIDVRRDPVDLPIYMFDKQRGGRQQIKSAMSGRASSTTVEQVRGELGVENTRSKASHDADVAASEWARLPNTASLKSIK